MYFLAAVTMKYAVRVMDVIFSSVSKMYYYIGMQY